MHTTGAGWVLDDPPAPLPAGERGGVRGPFTNDRLQGALAALSHALHNIAPLYLMCDPNDLGRVYEIRSPHTGRPTIYLYERAPGGVGLAERLVRLHDGLVHSAVDPVSHCGCQAGCPA